MMEFVPEMTFAFAALVTSLTSAGLFKKMPSYTFTYNLVRIST